MLLEENDDSRLHVVFWAKLAGSLRGSVTASLCQKSRIWWLELGDQNIAFFHCFIHSCMSRNFVLSVVDLDGSWLTSHYGMVSWPLIIFVTVWDPRLLAIGSCLP